MVDAHGIPLAAVLSATNVQDWQYLEATLDAVPRIRGRCRPAKLHADKAYDYRHVRRMLRRRHIQSRIARKAVESSTRLGRHRWVVERTFAWLNRYRRLVVRYERRVDIHQAFLTLGCCLICWNFVQRFC